MRPETGIETLVALAAAGQGPDPARRLARQLLGADARPRTDGGVSQLNGDGTPLQLCLSSSTRGVGTRFVADPAYRCGDAEERLALSGSAARAAIRSHGPALEPLFDVACEALIPDGTNERRAFTRGFFWLAAATNGPGIAVYFDVGTIDDAWTRVQRWLEATLPDSTQAIASLEAMKPHIRLASVGIEGSSPADARAKVYFRLAHAVPLTSLGGELLASGVIGNLLARVVGQRAMRFSGAVFGLGFSIATGAPTDAKLDLCGHCLPRSGAEWWETIETLVHDYGIEPFDPRIHAALLAGTVDVAFVGAGVARDGRVRVNVYLKERSSAHAIEKAVRYLLSIRNDDGSWSDYRLPVGRSSEWVTAFIGLALASVARFTPEAEQAAREAARWLIERRTYEAGWGYNATTGADADSTGFALRLLATLGIERSARDEAWLLGKWRQDGGFATYDGPHCWGDAHPCVTAAAFPALSPNEATARREALLRYVDSTRAADGTWPAYWWRSHAYSTLQHLRLLRDLGVQVTAPSPAKTPADVNAFELACLAGIEHLAGRRESRDQLTSALLATQRHDGSFPGAANLRVTDPDCARPWVDPRGALYTDERATITTAMALMTLEECADA